MRSHLTDFHFAYNLPYTLFEQIVRDVLAERGAQSEDLLVTFNPELAPQRMLFEQAQAIENLPVAERARADARLREIKVVLIRTLISDQLAYINIAKEWFTVCGPAKRSSTARSAGERSAVRLPGCCWPLRILSEVADDEVRSLLRIPESFFLGADVMYGYMTINNLLHWGDQKYKDEQNIRADYPLIQKEYLEGEFPEDIQEKLRHVLNEVEGRPLIVRSSSLLEDNFGTSFAGKYDSVFCPNQGSAAENLTALSKAISHVYASALNPDALLYRRSKKLQDYDERMAVLIQVVQGERSGRYYLPNGSGVAFSRNLYRWSPQIRRDAGFLRLVWGLGTRAVERVGNDYPRLVALSHPLLHPESSPKAIRRYSQQYVDVIDLEENSFDTLPVAEVMHSRYPALRYIVQVDQGGYLAPIRSMLMEEKPSQLVITFDELFRRTRLADNLVKMLTLLETHYHSPVDTEFTIHIPDPSDLQPDVEITLLQCRPQSHLVESEVRLPKNIPEEDIVFSIPRMVPQGRVEEIRYVVFVTPQAILRCQPRICA